MDNVFIERLWRSLEHEDIYLKGYVDRREAHAGIGSWIAFYNGRRPHQALGSRTPMAVWREGISGGFGKLAVDMTAALRQRWRVAHMPTAATATAAICSLISSGERSGRESN
jgi:putative transposase